MGSETARRGSGDAWGPGEQHLRATVRRLAARQRAGNGRPPPGPQPRREAGLLPRSEAGLRPRSEAGLRPRSEAGLQPRSEAGLQPRTDDPQPYDDDWGWWIEFHLGRIEAQIKWLVALAAGALAAEVLRVALAALGLP